jgi:hypothetical protein
MQTLVEDFLQSLRHACGRLLQSRSGNFLFAIRAGRSKVGVMSVEQIEATIESLSASERRKFVRWFDAHRDELLATADFELSDSQKKEILHRRREYDEHPERFVRMNKKSLDQMFNRVRKNVAARLSSAR